MIRTFAAAVVLAAVPFAATPASAGCTDDFVAAGPGENPGPFSASQYYATGYVHTGPGTIVVESAALISDAGVLAAYEVGRVTHTVAITSTFVSCVSFATQQQ